MIPLKPSIRFFPILNENGKNRALNENVCSILLFFMNTIKSLSPFTDQEYAHSCNILYCLVFLVLKMQMSVLCVTQKLKMSMQGQMAVVLLRCNNVADRAGVRTTWQSRFTKHLPKVTWQCERNAWWELLRLCLSGHPSGHLIPPSKLQDKASNEKPHGLTETVQ